MSEFASDCHVSENCSLLVYASIQCVLVSKVTACVENVRDLFKFKN